MTTVQIELPWPPSVNGYWRRGTTFGGKRNMALSPKARMFRWYAVQRARRALPLGWEKKASGKFRVSITAFPPDERRRDLDNLLKATLDALAHAGVYADDRLVTKLSIERMEKCPRGRLDVTVERLA